MATSISSLGLARRSTCRSSQPEWNDRCRLGRLREAHRTGGATALESIFTASHRGFCDRRGGGSELRCASQSRSQPSKISYRSQIASSLLGVRGFRPTPRPCRRRRLVLFNRLYQPDIDLVRLSWSNDVSLSNPGEIRLGLLWLSLLAGRLPAFRSPRARASRPQAR